MNENEIDVPIYLITGFLESGKTTFINFTLQQELLSDRGADSSDHLRRRAKRNTTKSCC